MNLLSKISYWKINYLSTRIEIRSILNVLGLCSDIRAEEKNKKDFFEVVKLMGNLERKEREKVNRYVKRHKD